MARVGPGDYVRFRELGDEFTMIVDSVEESVGGDTVYRGEVSDKYGSDAARYGTARDIGEIAEVRAERADPVDITGGL